MKRTVFYDIHQSLGAKLIEFGGFEMPVQYEGIIAEHKAVRNSVGVFDVSHMGEFEVTGKNAEAFLQKVTTNDVGLLQDGSAQYSTMLYEGDSHFPDGGIVDDLIIYRINSETFFLIVNASNIEKDFAWLSKFVMPEMALVNTSEKLSLLAIQGRHAEQTLQKLTDVKLSEIGYYHFVFGKLAGYEMMIARTGYTGEAGFEICFQNEFGIDIWNQIFAAGKEFNIKPIGLGARDTLRLEMGYSLYGHEITHETNPIEAGLGWITKLDKGDFNGRTVCAETKTNPSRKLVGFVLNNKLIARQGYSIVNESDEVIGAVCSGTISPMLDKPIGTGYVTIPYSKVGSTIYIKIRGQKEAAQIIKPPFWKNSTNA